MPTIITINPFRCRMLEFHDRLEDQINEATDKLAALQKVMRPAFRWQRVPSSPPGLPLYLLQEGDCRALATNVSCGQDIAGDGAFSLAMIADYLDSLTTYGAAFYRNRFPPHRSRQFRGARQLALRGARQLRHQPDASGRADLYHRAPAERVLLHGRR